MKITMNGEAREVREGLTVEALLALIQFQEPMVATEVNMEIIPRARRGDTVLREGDRVEIVSFVGGG